MGQTAIERIIRPLDSSYPAIGEVYTSEKGTEKRKQVACWKGIREPDWEDVRKKEAVKKKKEREKAVEIDELFGERLMEQRREEGEWSTILKISKIIYTTYMVFFYLY